MFGEKRAIIALQRQYLKEKLKPALEFTGINVQESLPICKTEI